MENFNDQDNLILSEKIKQLKGEENYRKLVVEMNELDRKTTQFKCDILNVVRNSDLSAEVQADVFCRFYERLSNEGEIQ